LLSNLPIKLTIPPQGQRRIIGRPNKRRARSLSANRLTDAHSLDRGNPFMRTTAIIMVLGIVSMGCATSYRPQEPGRISLVLDGPGFSLHRDGKEYGAMGLSSAPIRAVEGNPLAEEHARTYVRRSRIAWALYGIALASLVTAVALNPNGHAQGEQRQAGLIFGISGLTTLLAGGAVFVTAPSHLYDAVNIYNDGRAGAGR
jgi:hypothetical protein